MIHSVDFNKTTNTCASVLPLLDEIYRIHGLTTREIEIANMMVIEGLGYKEISQKINRNIVTVKNHAINIFWKFNVKRRGEFMSLLFRKCCTR